MSSTKRYKQSSENSNRFQDIPPRFKRQKSITSQRLQSGMDSTPQNIPHFQKNKKSLGESFSSNGSVSIPKGYQFPREGRKIVKKLSTQKAQQNAEKNMLKPCPQPFVLSPMENKLFSLVRNDGNENPQISATNNEASCASGSNMCPQSAVPLCDSFTNNSNIYHPNIHSEHSNTDLCKPDPYGWVGTNQTIPEVNPSCQQRFSPSPSVSSHRSMYNESPNANYSDPDIRTIEMLRELERVADQTDVGSEESNNDKNSLVSHHLRMLMCAVDRYTQGVENEMDSDKCEDEVLPPEAPRYIPSPPQHQIKSFSHHQEFSDTDSAYSDDFLSPSKPVNQLKTAPVNQGTLNLWNPWSTPSFNGLDVYAISSPNAAHHQNHTHYASQPSVFMFDNGMYHARNTF